jgi:hypothetical protein
MKLTIFAASNMGKAVPLGKRQCSLEYFLAYYHCCCCFSPLLLKHEEHKILCVGRKSVLAYNSDRDINTQARRIISNEVLFKSSEARITQPTNTVQFDV